MSDATEETFDEIAKTFEAAVNAVRFLAGWCILLTIGVIANFILLVVL